MASVPVRILLIQSWVVRTDELRTRLVAAGYAPKLYRVDFEAALHAALSRGNFDVVLYDPATPQLPRALVESCFKAHNLRAPVMDVVDDPRIGERIRTVLGALRN